MSTTYNQIPPVSQGKLFYIVKDGELVFSEQRGKLGPKECEVWRDGPRLKMMREDAVLGKTFRDHDDPVDDELLEFFYECEETPFSARLRA